MYFGFICLKCCRKICYSSSAAEAVPSGARTHAASGISEVAFGMTSASSATGVAAGGVSSGITHAASGVEAAELGIMGVDDDVDIGR